MLFTLHCIGAFQICHGGGIYRSGYLEGPFESLSATAMIFAVRIKNEETQMEVCRLVLTVSGLL